MASTSSEPVKVDLMQLKLPQLNAYKLEMEQELDFFRSSLETLKMAERKFALAKESMERIAQYNKPSLLIPLSSSLYADGKLNDNKIMINVGTGFYIKKDTKGAVEYCERRMAYVNEQIEMVQRIYNEKAAVRDIITQVMKNKLNVTQESQAMSSAMESTKIRE